MMPELDLPRPSLSLTPLGVFVMVSLARRTVPLCSKPRVLENALNQIMLTRLLRAQTVCASAVATAGEHALSGMFNRVKRVGGL